MPLRPSSALHVQTNLPHSQHCTQLFQSTSFTYLLSGHSISPCEPNLIYILLQHSSVTSRLTHLKKKRKIKTDAFPLPHFRDGAPKYTYEGENNKAGIVSFMKNPGKAPEKPKEEVWADTPSDVTHLTDATFHEFVKVLHEA